MGNHITRLWLPETEREALEEIVRKPKTPQYLAFRARIILMSADGVPVREIVTALNTTRTTVRKWKLRFLKQGLAGLHDASRTGKPRKYGDMFRRQIITLATNPPRGLENLSIRKLADYIDCNRGIVERVLKHYSINLQN